MATLAGRQISASYTELLKTSVAGGLDATLRAIEDGDATAAALQLSTAGVKSTGTLEVTGASTLTGAVTIADTTQSTTKDTGCLVVEGGIGVEKNATVGGTLAVTGATTLSSTVTLTGAVTISNTTEATTKDTGCLIVEGGIGVEKTVFATALWSSGALTVGTTSLFSGGVTLLSSIGVSGAATFDGAVTLGNGAGDTITVTGTPTFAQNSTFSADVSAATVSGAAVATQAQMETASATNLVVTPGRVKFSPGVAKAFVRFNSVGTILGTAHNVSTVVRNSAGNYTVTFTTAFGDANYAAVASSDTGVATAYITTPLAGSCILRTNGNTDAGCSLVVFGDFA